MCAPTNIGVGSTPAENQGFPLLPAGNSFALQSTARLPGRRRCIAGTQKRTGEKQVKVICTKDFEVDVECVVKAGWRAPKTNSTSLDPNLDPR
jgi:hypothetical protein